MSPVFPSKNQSQARQAAYAATSTLKPQPTSIVAYQSRGHLLLIGNPQSIDAFGEPPEGLSLETIRGEGLPHMADITIQGALGQFVVTVAGQTIKADLILDLMPRPILGMSLKPPGYITADLSRQNLQHLKHTLSELRGTFEKPRYFDYNESLCAHGRSGKKGCTRCLEACPAEAITSQINKIQVDPYRCQGGGICATVCPSGAIRYAYPKPEDLLTQLRVLILSYLKAGGSAPDLIFATEEQQQRAQQALPSALLITVEEVASVGPEVWLSAISWGARSVRLFDLDNMPPTSRQALELPLAMVQTLLSAMNYPATAVALLTDSSELITCSVMPDITPSAHAVTTEKRQAFYLALDHLVTQAEKTNPQVTLPSGSIFGEVILDQSRCTLCMACVSACPGNALQDGRTLPQLGFLEANCLQCGLCTSTCPENAIHLSPRLLLDHEQRQTPRILHEETPFCCITCGKPFATTSGITTIISKLAGHALFADERASNRLKMCSDCRVKDMMEDPDVEF